ncbi:hypothetical protein [Entomospira culicis]|uniref:Uncharacterized protein n=1 Tax=Entomospira culicis TaxID=2719989 RepID=A0A968GGK8_9SPIO|nr:hypothetical protein [Entomospira culicis]NIZ18408.1 hypothetical protein [Entomospira culicis]NIZ68624.1 hypothetical protein [Entomospira culicis]WDI37224.1 hypothetical protein PVA46_00090 [Entomospira culicis]WDI38852.1 hypothetical protein PVA47_00100 [Entomospira culicis]
MKKISPFRLFGKRNVWIFIGSVLFITLVINGIQIVDSYRNKKLLKQLESQQRLFSPSEYQALLRLPTIQDYIFPEEPLDFTARYQPWRSSVSLEERMALLGELWIDPQALAFEQLPDRSRQNLRDYIASVRAEDPNF